MGWKSTIDLTREEAIEILRGVGLEALSDEQLADMVEEFYGGDSHGHNYRIVASKETKEDE